jgi:hypothetical protein
MLKKIAAQTNHLTVLGKSSWLIVGAASSRDLHHPH